MFNDALLSSKKDDWETPRNLFDVLNSLFDFTLDPCANETNNLGLPWFWTEKDDGLSREWGDHVAFANPPYGKTQKKFVEKALSEKNAKSVFLIPARPDTVLWQDIILTSNVIEILFLRGRIQFVRAKWPAPFPCALVFINFPLNKKQRLTLKTLGTFR